MEIFANAIAISMFFVMVAFTIVGCTYIYYLRRRSQDQAHTSEKMQELRNEELRLRIQLHQLEEEKMEGSFSVDPPRPKEPSREEQAPLGYDMGYQLQRG